MSVFAGFWVDGAVRKPEARHFDRNGWVIANWKDKRPDLDICRKNFDRWNEVFWLDTTPRESLTPGELYSVVKVLWPELQYVDLATDGGWCVASDQTNNETPVQWNGLERYPPPTDPQWIRVTRKNVGQYLFRLCRCRDSESESWQDGHIVGWDMEDEDCLVDGDFDPVERVLKFSFVEVQA